MGLFDAYDPNTYQGSGGLLDRLLSQLGTQSQYQPSPGFPGAQPSPLDSAQWPAGPNGAPSQANAQMPMQLQNDPIAVGNYQMPRIGGGFPQGTGPNEGGLPRQSTEEQAAGQLPAPFQAANRQPQGAPMQAMAQMQPQQLTPRAVQGIPDAFLRPAGGGVGGFFRGLAENAHNGLLGMAIGGVAGASGQSQGDIHNRQLNAQYQALIAAGVPQPKALLATINPEFAKTIATEALGPQTLTPLGEGYVADKHGNVTRAYEPSDKNKIVKIGQDGLGREQYGVFNPADGSVKPYNAPGGTNDTSGGIGNMDLTGAAYLATVPKAQAGIMQGMVDGTMQPPSSFALSKPYWQNMLAGAKNLDPNFDANNWTSRHKMSNDIAASSNTSMGGILSNGKSSFKHLAEYTESAADLGNASHDYPMGGAVAEAQNYLGNRVFAGSDTRGKIKAINDNLGKYGAESTKFYAGTGGGVEERLGALKEMNPTITSSAEMAAYAEKEKGLMLDRLREKEKQIRDVMGDGYLQKHPVFDDELKKDIARIDANVAKLRGSKGGGTVTASDPLGIR